MGILPSSKDTINPPPRSWNNYIAERLHVDRVTIDGVLLFINYYNDTST